MKRSKAVYILPNLFTSLNLAAGFYSILLAHSGKFLLSAWVVMFAVVFDNLDGKVARLTHTESQFGVEYDSLSDLVSFGVAPAFLMYVFVLKDFGRLGVIAAFLFMICGALRLARFNVQTTHRDSFIGLPIPGGASVVAAFVLVFIKFGINSHKYNVLFLVTMYILAFLMISPLKYRSMKKASTDKTISIRIFALIVIIISLIVFKPYIFIPALVVGYMLSGPVEYLYKLIKPKRGVAYEQEDSNI
ncbi:CDP-diacylglycerol--serine O-phosphatidyltransferase [Hippea maritima]|uniref:CDP-diacylglycerol--serine O-phosphatidyltransferase n=1 Tax=Hippea maritima (strain ATCC 700847 / DSM 10411 / MH2) TaxID=760142 RepID=F2LV97_HIPMA|nr:CDP-diacylglycerol--serine O-phosphatidyltransferase [Hippea maritima]AEA33681.1 CDP-diacylglycerol/serineO-phosphatidyltransferase [Hippea maritima DSM 10411]